ncbi:hypothetical protein HQM25_17150 [Microbacterium hominis]|uniref:SbsA Ig-like domain-containing protein n=1 Tax=Microbacterium hominis TaxID=162426 RepID=A0A7D4PPY5_9MICO|nr:hypothetical protein HQM25_17150 [Microbacterium hominis]
MVVAVLAVVGLVGAAASVALGPRVTEVSVDPDAAVAASGSRLIVTTSQSLAEVTAEQVTVTPETPFAVDTSGRSVGVRFGTPLRDETEYTVTFSGLTGVGGGPAVEITETFRTPAIEVHLLQRGGDEDTIFRTDLGGEQAQPVFRHPHIEDFRATASHLVISVRTDDDRAALIVTDLDGGDERELPLPGNGFVSNLQAADRGETIGYTFSDADLGAEGGRESMLYTASVAPGAADAEPTAVAVEGVDPRVDQWRFVPETDSILVLTFDSTLLLAGATGEGATTLGNAVSIEGIAGTDAIVERVDGIIVIDLTDASEAPLVEADAELGRLDAALPVPGGGTLRTYAQLDADGFPVGSRIAFVDDDGRSQVVADVDPADAVLQNCVSPSGRYAATLIAPDAVTNRYDQYLLPMPETVETRLAELDDATALVALSGFDISWCRVPPS